eukprot:3078589-Pyramimonas_sp.AAC.1
MKPKHVYEWMKAATHDDWKRYKAASGQAIYVATVGPKDIVYMPAAFVFYEKIGPADFAGVRMVIIQKSQSQVLEEIQRFLISVNSQHPLLDMAVDTLAMLD